jgi:hypothetical protein
MKERQTTQGKKAKRSLREARSGKMSKNAIQFL